jgi:hypothetical protein
MQTAELSFNVDDLARYIFTENTNDARIQLCLHGIQNSRQLFVFLVNLLCKGLLYLYGNPVGPAAAATAPQVRSVDVHALSEDQLDYVRGRLRLAGIDVKVVPFPNLEDEPPSSDIHDIAQSLPVDAPLQDFVFRIVTRDVIYKVHFEWSSLETDRSAFYGSCARA